VIKYPLALKTLLVLLSLVIAWGLWYALVQILIVSGVPPIQKMAVVLSPWTYFGWLLFLSLSGLIHYLISSKLFRSKT
jgi:hypothetical protein